MLQNTLPAHQSHQRQFYESEGYVVVREVFNRHVMAELSAEAERLLERRDLIVSDNIRCRWQNHFETNACLFDCFDPVIDLGEFCTQVAHDNRLLAILASLYGEPARLFKDKLIYKPPGAKGYALHQDFIAWKNFPRSFVTVVVAIDPSDADCGAIEVFPGYHKQGCLTPEDGDYHELPVDQIDEKAGVLLELEPGDVAIFGAFTPHRSAPNRSNHWRRQLYLSYNADSEGGDQRYRHYAEFLVWLTKKYTEYGKTGVYFK